MNSSGIKRGLAATAVAALAVTGLPFLASSASAAALGGDESIAFSMVGPSRNGGTAGGAVVLKTKNVSQADAVNFGLADYDMAGQNPDTANQTVAIKGVYVIQDGTGAGQDGNNDGFDSTVLLVSAKTRNDGDAAKFSVFLDQGAAPDYTDLDINDPAVKVSVTTAGAPKSVTLTPSSQTAAAGVSAGYTASFKDAAGNLTQLNTGEGTVTTADADLTFNGGDASVAFPGAVDTADADTIAATFPQVAYASYDFEAESSVTTVHSFTVKAGTASTNGTLDVTAAAGAASITPAMIDVVTGKDNRDGFGKSSTTVKVRSDQTSITYNIKAPGQKGKTVTLTATGGGGVMFGSSTTTTVSTTLNSQGVGSVTVTPTASTIVNNGTVTLSGSALTASIVATFENSKITSDTIKPTALEYTSAYGGSIDVGVRVTDQFGDPQPSVYVTVNRANGANGSDAESARKAVNANGEVTFTLTDTKATAASHDPDDLTFTVYPGTLGAELAHNDAANINYTPTGVGPDYILKADGVLNAGSAYNPDEHFVNPLTDAIGDDAGDSTDELMPITVTGATTNAPITVSATNGALIVSDVTGTDLADGAASLTGVVGDDFYLIGTKTGRVTVTTTSAGVTKTAEVSVHTDAEAATPTGSAAGTARNIEVTAPESAKAGETVVFTVTVTDAFGNPVFGVPATDLARLLSGPGSIIGNDTKSDSNGEIEFRVAISDDADRPVTLTVNASDEQFGAAANRYDSSSTTDDAPGLTASVKDGAATIENIVNIEQLEQAVADAQAKVDAAQDNLDAAKGDLAVAKAERSVAQKAVKEAKKDLRKAKKSHKGVKAARKALREARGDLRIASAKVSAAQGKVNTATTRLAAAQAELEAAQQALEDAQS